MLRCTLPAAAILLGAGQGSSQLSSGMRRSAPVIARGLVSTSPLRESPVLSIKDARVSGACSLNQSASALLIVVGEPVRSPGSAMRADGMRSAIHLRGCSSSEVLLNSYQRLWRAGILIWIC